MRIGPLMRRDSEVESAARAADETLHSGGRVMGVQQDFSEQLKRQIELWQAQIKEYQAQLGEAGAKARADYESGIAQLRKNTDEAGQLLQKVQHANEAA